MELNLQLLLPIHLKCVNSFNFFLPKNFKFYFFFCIIKEGEKDHPVDEIFVRSVSDNEVKPKAKKAKK